MPAETYTIAGKKCDYCGRTIESDRDGFGGRFEDPQGRKVEMIECNDCHGRLSQSTGAVGMANLLRQKYYEKFGNQNNA